ncbi:MAG: transcriptional repressor [Acidobacteria bacterium]|nr:transcriptional repressor [Acidobacteriota bacterium]
MSLRKTRQSLTIRSIFQDETGPLTAVEIHSRAKRTVPGVGIATVYRQIGKLVQEGWLTEVVLAGEPARFERAGKPHHHHFVCRSCRQVFEVPGCVDGWQRILPTGFRALGHELTLYGECAVCVNQVRTSNDNQTPSHRALGISRGRKDYASEPRAE